MEMINSEWRKVKVIENEHICKTLVPNIWSRGFLVNFGHILHTVFLIFFIDFEQVNTGWEGLVNWKIYVVFILILLAPVYRGYYALPCQDL